MGATLERRTAVRGMEQQGPFFEHACHEGNRAPTNMMSVVRHQEKLAAEAAAKKSSN